MIDDFEIRVGDALEELRQLPNYDEDWERTGDEEWRTVDTEYNGRKLIQHHYRQFRHKYTGEVRWGKSMCNGVSAMSPKRRAIPRSDREAS